MGIWSSKDDFQSIYFERRYTDLPLHNEIEFEITVLLTKDWGIKDKFELMFDSTILEGWSFGNMTYQFTSSKCSNTNRDFSAIMVKGRVIHLKSTLILKIVHHYEHKDPNESLGFGNIKIKFNSNQIQNTFNDKICLSSLISLESKIKTCTCSEREYEYPVHSGQCFPCDSGCLACTGPSSAECSSYEHKRGRSLSTSLCDPSCNTCSGATSDDCLTCADGYRAIVDNDGSLSCALVESFWNAPMELGATTFVALCQIMQYVRYLDVKMSPRLQHLVVSSNRYPFTLMLGFGIPENIKDRFTKLDFDPLFERQGFHSSFFVNFWPALTSFGILFLSAVLSYIFEKLFKRIKLKFMEEISYRFRILFAWNLIFILHAVIIGDIILYSYLEISTFSASQNDSLSNFSLAVCILVIIATIIFLLGTALLIRKVHHIEISAPPIRYNTSSKNFMKRIEDMRTLWDGFNNKTAYGRYFFLLYTMRITLPYLFAICFKNIPILQVVIQMITNIFIVYCMFSKHPLIPPVLHSQYIVFESIVFLINIPVLAITIMDAAGIDNLNQLVVLGDIIIIGNFILNVLVMVWLSTKMILATRKVLLARHKISKQYVFLGLLEMLALPHQGGMGFELVYEIKNYNAPIKQNEAADTEMCEFKFDLQRIETSPSKILPFNDDQRQNNNDPTALNTFFFPQSPRDKTGIYQEGAIIMDQTKLECENNEEKERLDRENASSSRRANQTHSEEEEKTQHVPL